MFRSFCFLIASIVAVITVADDAVPPNIVIMLADDLGFSDLGCYGGEIETPNLDAMADAGVRFTQFYNTARCWPTRAALMTGYYAQQVRRDAIPGVRGGGQGQRPDWATLLPEKLKAAGYRSHHSGKWHIDGEPTRTGFDHSYYLKDLGRLFSPKVHTLDEQKLAPENADGGYYATDAIAERAVEFLRQHDREHSGEPFLSFVAFSAPHFPLQAPADAIAKYRGRYDAGWDVMRKSRFDAMQSMFRLPATLSALEPDVGPPYHFDKVAKTFGDLEVERELEWKSLTDRQRAFQSMKMEIHAAMVDVMDAAIGRVLNQLDKMGVADNTIVMFLSDNGASAELMVRGDGHDMNAANGSAATHLCLGPGFSRACNTPFRRHKTWVHEGGIATPLVVRWPAGIRQPGGLRNQAGHVIDLVPTILAAAGLLIEAVAGGPPMPGQNLIPALTDDSPVGRPSLWWLHDGHRAIRVDDWKLVAAEGEPWELYDLSADRSETNDLADAFPARVAEMAAIWTAESNGIANLHGQPIKHSK